MLRHTAPDGARLILLQHRVWWSHHGDTWGLPGGARRRGESAAQAALREAVEEVDVDLAMIRLVTGWVEDHGGWSYHTMIADTDQLLTARPGGGESAAVRWVPEAAVETLPLHPGFAAAWPRLRAM